MRLAHGMAFWIISDAISYIEYDCPKAQFLILRERHTHRDILGSILEWLFTA